MNPLNKYMSYKRISDIPFPWEYQNLMNLPLFMIEHIYQMLDQYIEQDKQRANASGPFI